MYERVKIDFVVENQYGPLAQLDRVSDYGSEG